MNKQDLVTITQSVMQKLTKENVDIDDPNKRRDFSFNLNKYLFDALFECYNSILSNPNRKGNFRTRTLKNQACFQILKSMGQLALDAPFDFTKTYTAPLENLEKLEEDVSGYCEEFVVPVDIRKMAYMYIIVVNSIQHEKVSKVSRTV